MSTQSLMVIDHAAGVVRIDDSAVQLRTEAIAAASLVGTVKTPEQQERAVAALKLIKGLKKQVEDGRKSAKEPFLETARLIDFEAKSFVERLNADELRINTAIGNYQQELADEVRRQERIRQAELQRIENEERDAKESVAKAAREAEATRQAEERRLSELAAKETNEVEKQRLAEEQTRLANERAKAEKLAIAEQARQSALADQQREAVGPAVVAVQASGQTSRETFDYDVTNLWALARAHPGLVEITPRRQEILDLLNKHGMKELAGLRIFSTIKTTIRTAPGKAIEV